MAQVMAEYGTTAQALKLIARLCCDQLPKQLDAAYVFSETADNQHGTLEHAVNMRFLWDRIAVCGEAPRGTNYCGIDWTMDYLGQLKTEGTQIIPIPLEAGHFHTMSEARALVRHATEARWQKVAVIWPLFHLRVFPSVVTAIGVQSECRTKFYSVPVYLPMGTRVRHSRDEPDATREALMRLEWKKAGKYWKAGDLVSIDRVIGYFYARDRR